MSKEKLKTLNGGHFNWGDPALAWEEEEHEDSLKRLPFPTELVARWRESLSPSMDDHDYALSVVVVDEAGDHYMWSGEVGYDRAGPDQLWESYGWKEVEPRGVVSTYYAPK